MKAKDRQKVFDKCNGRCAYCGCELTGRWHVDHMDPVIRYKDRLPRTYKHFETGDIIEEDEYYALWASDPAARRMYEALPVRYLNKTQYPERDTIENSIPACASCNINKGGCNVETFRFSISNGVESLNKQHAQYRMAKRFGLISETAKPVVFYFETLTQPNNNT